MDKKYEIDFSLVSQNLAYENSSLKIELYGLQQVIEELENKVGHLEKENARLHQKLSDKNIKGGE